MAELSATASRQAADRRAAKALQRLYLTLFLRGNNARQVDVSKAPTSTARKLASTLLIYAFFGGGAIFLLRLPLFYLSIYLHASTFTIVGLFVAVSAGSQLFNPDDADILLHRPIRPEILLRAKIHTLVSVALWLSAAMNILTMFAVLLVKDHGLSFVVAHTVSLFLETIFCTATIVLLYQVCLRWMGRERLDNWMTFTQTLLTFAMIASSQLLPQLIIRGKTQVPVTPVIHWWMMVLPPAWFAGLDELIVGSPQTGSILLALLAVVGTTVSAWLAFERLAKTHHSNLQLLLEGPMQKLEPGRQRLSYRWLQSRWIKWLLRDRIVRASFQLVVVHLLHDRDTKMRVYPGVAPVLVLPTLWLFSQDSSRDANMSIAMCGALVATYPSIVLTTLQYSRNWQAAEIFRIAPLSGPSKIMAGARQAVFWVFMLPLILLMLTLVILKRNSLSDALFLLPGFLMIPVYLYLPFLRGHCIPLSSPIEESKSTRQGLIIAVMSLLSFPVSMASIVAHATGYFWTLILLEVIIGFIAILIMRRVLRDIRWEREPESK